MSGSAWPASTTIGTLLCVPRVGIAGGQRSRKFEDFDERCEASNKPNWTAYIDRFPNPPKYRFELNPYIALKFIAASVSHREERQNL